MLLCAACVLKVLYFRYYLFLVYRNDKYKKLKAEVEKHCKKCKLGTEISLIKFENLLDSVYDFILQWRGRRKQQQTCLVDKRRKLVRNYFGGILSMTRSGKPDTCLSCNFWSNHHI